MSCVHVTYVSYMFIYAWLLAIVGRGPCVRYMKWRDRKWTSSMFISHQVDSNFEELNLCSILDWGNACGCDFDRFCHCAMCILLDWLYKDLHSCTWDPKHCSHSLPLPSFLLHVTVTSIGAECSFTAGPWAGVSMLNFLKIFWQPNSLILAIKMQKSTPGHIDYKLLLMNSCNMGEHCGPLHRISKHDISPEVDNDKQLIS